MTDINDIIELSCGLNVLYVEDDNEVRRQTVDIFEDFFNILDVAVDGVNAIAKYNEYNQKNNKHYDIVITDIVMPNKDGVELTKDILKINQDQRIIVVSAHNDSAYLRSLINLGVVSFFLKPIEMDQLLKTLLSTCRAIKDSELAKTYQENLENLNDQLMQKNDLLEQTIEVLQSHLNNNTILDKNSLEGLINNIASGSVKY